VNSVFAAVLARDLRLAARRRIESLLPVAFFLVAVSLFPLGVGPEPQTLRQIAPGIVWVCSLLAAMLSVNTLYAGDLADGSLEQMLLAPGSVLQLVWAKAAAHWLVSGLPLIVAAPVIGLMFGLPAQALATLVVGLLLGTPILSLLGSLGAALTLGLRSGGMLLILIVLPLATPTLIFGAGAVDAVGSGLSASGHHSLLGALLIASALGVPWATAAALRISTE
jgi:heme exporter protein B